MVWINIFIALVSFGCAVSHAGESLSFRTGANLSNHEKTAIYSVGYEEVSKNNLVLKVDLGGWTDSSPSRRSSPFSNISTGIMVGDYDGFNGKALFGVTFVGFTDDATSTPIEFTQDIELGYRGVGVGYVHFSNFGIKQPNSGRGYFFVNLTTTLF